MDEYELNVLAFAIAFRYEDYQAWSKKDKQETSELLCRLFIVGTPPYPFSYTTQKLQQSLYLTGSPFLKSQETEDNGFF